MENVFDSQICIKKAELLNWNSQRYTSSHAIVPLIFYGIKYVTHVNYLVQTIQVYFYMTVLLPVPSSFLLSFTTLARQAILLGYVYMGRLLRIKGPMIYRPLEIRKGRLQTSYHDSHSLTCLTDVYPALFICQLQMSSVTVIPQDIITPFPEGLRSSMQENWIPNEVP